MNKVINAIPQGSTDQLEQADGSAADGAAAKPDETANAGPTTIEHVDKIQQILNGTFNRSATKNDVVDKDKQEEVGGTTSDNQLSKRQGSRQDTAIKPEAVVDGADDQAPTLRSSQMSGNREAATTQVAPIPNKIPKQLSQQRIAQSRYDHQRIYVADNKKVKVDRAPFKSSHNRQVSSVDNNDASRRAPLRPIPMASKKIAATNEAQEDVAKTIEDSQ